MYRMVNTVNDILVCLKFAESRSGRGSESGVLDKPLVLPAHSRSPRNGRSLWYPVPHEGGGLAGPVLEVLRTYMHLETRCLVWKAGEGSACVSYQ